MSELVSELVAIENATEHYTEGCVCFYMFAFSPAYGQLASSSALRP